jgi:hypothetical protein
MEISKVEEQLFFFSYLKMGKWLEYGPGPGPGPQVDRPTMIERKVKSMTTAPRKYKNCSLKTHIEK